MLSKAQLQEAKCRPQVDALTEEAARALLPEIDGWAIDGQRIVRMFHFKDFHETVGFVDAIAHVIHAEDHHPELTVTYDRCIVRYDTHSVNGGRGGLSLNDFICAAKMNAIFPQSSN